MSARELFDNRLQPALKRAAGWEFLRERDQWYGKTHGAPDDQEGRAFLSGLLSVQAHQSFVESEIPEIVNVLIEDSKGLAPNEIAFIRRLAHCIRHAQKLPLDFVKRRSVVTSRAHSVWEQARPQNRFDLVRPELERVVEIVREESELCGGRRGDAYSMYNPLLECYEPEMKTEELAAIMDRVRLWLVPFLRRIRPGMTTGAPDYWRKNFPAEHQRELCLELLRCFGYQLTAGGFDVSAHPFCSFVGALDTKITTRFDERDGLKALSSTAHECGHALVEQWRPEHLRWALPYGWLLSLGTHESQSRLWQNHVFGSEPFWSYFCDNAGRYQIPRTGQSPADYYRAVNTVRPGLIRVDADEVTYNLHILLRVLLELRLVSGELTVADLPTAFNDFMAELLGIHPDSDRDGVMQDIQWFSGSFGYFGTYMLGSLAAAQLFAAFMRDVPDWENEFRKGNFQVLLEWLKIRVYSYVHTGTINSVLVYATGMPLNPEFWFQHIEKKFMS